MLHGYMGATAPVIKDCLPAIFVEAQWLDSPPMQAHASGAPTSVG